MVVVELKGVAAWCLKTALLLLLPVLFTVAKGEYVHKNLTEADTATTTVTADGTTQGS